MGNTAHDRGFYKSGGEYGFKLLHNRHIAILWIPEGAWVHVEAPSIMSSPITWWSLQPVFVPEDRWGAEQRYKHRASEARVVKILKLSIEYTPYGENDYRRRAVWDEVDEACSAYDASFMYRIGETVKPKLPFSSQDEACDSGIHYYTTLTKLFHEMSPNLFLADTLSDLTYMFGHAGEEIYKRHMANYGRGIDFSIDLSKADISLRFMHDIIKAINADMEVLKSNGATEIDGIDPLDYFPDVGFVV